MMIKKIVISFLCCSLILLLSSCTNELKDTFKQFNAGFESVFNEFEEAIDAIPSDNEMLENNEKGLELLDEGRPEAALVYFNENLETFKDDESVLDITFNNISLAYYQ